MSGLSKVLVIDDEKQILSAMKRSLAGYFDVSTAEDQKEALFVLENNDIDVVISDYNLESSITGADLLGSITERWPYISRIILTGYRTREIAEEAVNKAGVFKFLTKPWDDNDLKLIIYAAIKRSSVIRKNLRVLEDIKIKNKKIEATTKIIERELKLKEKSLIRSNESMSSVQAQLNSVNELLTRISSGRTFIEIVSAVLSGIEHVVDCDKASIASITDDNVLNVYSEGWNSSFNLNEHPMFVSTLDSMKDNNYSPITLSSIYARRELKEMLLKDPTIYSVLLYPLCVKTFENKSYTFVIALGRRQKEIFDRDDVAKLKDVSSSLYVALERLLIANLIHTGLKQWEDAFNSILDPLFILLPDFTIIRVNESIERITGLKSRSILGERCYTVFKHTDSPCENCLADKVFTTGKMDSMEGVPCFQNKSITATTYPVLDEQGYLTSVIQYNNDKSAEFKLYKQLIQSEKLATIGLLASNIAHEINNPLGGILAYAQLIKKDHPEKEILCSDMTEIEAACNRCKNIVSNLLDFSRDTSNEGKAVIPVKKIIDDTLPLLNVCIKNHRLSIDNSDDALFVMGNTGQLQQVLFNLITNAVHATPKGGDIRISMKKTSADNVDIEVADNGEGISDEVIPKIFEPFFTTKEKGTGTGLGLFVSYGIISDHGGDISVKSSRGKGATFKVTLPLHKEITV